MRPTRSLRDQYLIRIRQRLPPLFVECILRADGLVIAVCSCLDWSDSRGVRDGSIEDLYYEIGYNGIHTTRVFIAAMVLPLIWVSGWMQSLRDHRRNWRRAQNLCATCTYNLTGNTSGICPECGTAIPAKTDVPLSEIAG